MAPQTTSPSSHLNSALLGSPNNSLGVFVKSSPSNAYLVFINYQSSNLSSGTASSLANSENNYVSS